MQRLAHLAGAGALLVGFALLAPSCIEPPYVDTATPKDASFTLGCIGGCGREGREAGLLIEVSFSASGQELRRQYPMCCAERAAMRARLQTIEDFWCDDGLPVPDKQVGDLIVGTTKSDATGKRGATIDDGEGYVAFNCGEWLGQLIEQLGSTECCQPR